MPALPAAVRPVRPLAVQPAWPVEVQPEQPVVVQPAQPSVRREPPGSALVTKCRAEWIAMIADEVRQALVRVTR